MYAPKARTGAVRWRAVSIAAACALALLLAGCLTGDYGRVKPSLVADNTHDWVGWEAAYSDGRLPSTLPLTDDERRLRDLAFPLIEPPYDRQRWDSVLFEWGIKRSTGGPWGHDDYKTYGRKLLARYYRSASARYAQLVSDIRNDVVRVPPFFATARQVLDMDDKRARSLSYVGDLDKSELANARRRIGENALIVAWVDHSLRGRVEGYEYAIEHLLVATPSPQVLAAKRSLDLLRQQIAATRIDIIRPAHPPAVAAQ